MIQNDLFLVLTVFTLLLVKHFILDFLWQPKWMWANKGTFGHPGGIFHAGVHALGSMAILLYFQVEPFTAFLIFLAEFVLHYLIDWSKMNINKKMGWGANTHEQFWQLLGADQLAHHLTYAGMVYWAFYWKFQYG